MTNSHLNTPLNPHLHQLRGASCVSRISALHPSGNRLTGVAAMTESDFGGLLRRYRVAAGLTQEQLAERAGVSTRGISDLERGAHGLPRKDTLQLLLDAQPSP